MNFLTILSLGHDGCLGNLPPSLSVCIYSQATAEGSACPLFDLILLYCLPSLPAFPSYSWHRALQDGHCKARMSGGCAHNTRAFTFLTFVSISSKRPANLSILLHLSSLVDITCMVFVGYCDSKLSQRYHHLWRSAVSVYVSRALEKD